MRVLLTAQDFAFGPIGKLLYIAEELRKENYKLIFAGYGTSLQLAKRFSFDEVIEIDIEDRKNKKPLEKIISDCDILISSMDLTSYELAKKMGKVAIWLDCLFWFWDKIPESTFDANLYLSERFINESVNSSKYLSKIRNFVSVGPIMGESKNIIRKNKVLISFGGGQATHHYQAGRDTNYPFFMARILENFIDWSTFDSVTIATSETIVEKLKTRYPNSIFKFRTFAYDDFLKEIAESKLLLTTPGLITAEAAFFSKTPVIFIPASNDSQYLQLEELRLNGLAPASVGLMDYMPHLEMRHIPGKDSTMMMLKQLSEFEKDEELQQKVGSKLNEFVQNYDLWSNGEIAKGSKFVEDLGGNGAQAAANEINRLIQSQYFK